MDFSTLPRQSVSLFSKNRGGLRFRGGLAADASGKMGAYESEGYSKYEVDQMRSVSGVISGADRSNTYFDNTLHSR
jgi:hypothetical protein